MNNYAYMCISIRSIVKVLRDVSSRNRRKTLPRRIPPWKTATIQNAG
jgi:hypothetical protein